MVLLIFHLVLSMYTFEGVDINMAERIVKWNLKTFPNGASVDLLTRNQLMQFAIQVQSSCSAQVALLWHVPNRSVLWNTMHEQGSARPSTAT